MLTSVSWRNVWRSRIRSIVIIAAITLGVLAGIFSMGFSIGMIEQRINTAIKTETSNIQLHHKNYISTNEMDYIIPDIQQLKNKIEQKNSVSAASSRLISQAMITSAETGSGVKLVGINPEDEEKVTNIHEKVIDGAYLEGIKRNPILIGQKLAEKLNVKIRSKVVVTLQQADGTMTTGAFRVAGIYKTSNTTYDELVAFVKFEDLSKITGIKEGSGHEIAVYLNENDMTNPVKEELKNEYPDLEVLSWGEILPDLGYMNDSMSSYMYIFIIIILAALLFGIINTMLMVILERVKELGMLMAIGMNKLRVFMMIVLETIFLSITGGILGVGLGVALTKYVGKVGFNMSQFSEGLETYGFESKIYTEIGVEEVIIVTGLVILTGFIASLYPAYRALKLKPAEALRTE